MSTHTKSVDVAVGLAQPALPAGRIAARVRRAGGQAAIVAAVLAMVVGLAAAIHHSLAQQGITFSFAFLWRPANLDLSEGLELGWVGWWPKFDSVNAGSTNAQALVAGLLNTLKVALLAMAFSTILGVMLGVGRLSTNWLIRKLAFGVVEFVRNTPLLIQLVFWYFAVVLRLPPVQSAATLYGSLLLSQSGIFLPGLALPEDAGMAPLLFLAACVVLALATAIRRLPSPWRLAIGLAAIVCLAAAIRLGFPLVLDPPVIGRFGASGGINISPEMAAILLAVTVNSGAYTAEIVRGAIEAIPKGQWEASAALGLSRRDALRDIVLPQMFRIVLPSLGNRYISLTKDTSLGIAIGYPDLFNVYGTISNQTGRNLEGVLIVMATYLVVSWTISAAVNVTNARLSRRGTGA